MSPGPASTERARAGASPSGRSGVIPALVRCAHGPLGPRPRPYGQDSLTYSLGLSGRGVRVLALASVVALPWLSVKFVPVAAVIAAALVARSWPDRRRQLVLDLTVLAVAGAVYVAFHRSVYGGWTAYAAGDHFIDGELLVLGHDPDYLGRSRRLIGLLVDRGFGLAAWTPAYLLAVPALAAVARRRPPGWAALLAVVAAAYAVATWVALTMHGWWWPGRQLVAALPAAAVAVAMLADRRRGPRWLALGGCLVGILNWTWLVVEASTGRRTLVADFEETANPVYQAWSALLPDHRHFEGGAAALTAVWTAALVAAGVWGWLRSRPTPAGAGRAGRSAAAVPGRRRKPTAADATPPARPDPGAGE